VQASRPATPATAVRRRCWSSAPSITTSPPWTAGTPWSAALPWSPAPSSTSATILVSTNGCTAPVIELTYNNASSFTDWFNFPPNLIVDSKGLFIDGKDLFSDWPMTAATEDMLPAAVCGPGVSARQLYNQVYANWPTMRNADPWQT
jgi:hypothetical protein